MTKMTKMTKKRQKWQKWQKDTNDKNQSSWTSPLYQLRSRPFLQATMTNRSMKPTIYNMFFYFSDISPVGECVGHLLNVSAKPVARDGSRTHIPTSFSKTFKYQRHTHALLRSAFHLLERRFLFSATVEARQDSHKLNSHQRKSSVEKVFGRIGAQIER